MFNIFFLFSLLKSNLILIINKKNVMKKFFLTLVALFAITLFSYGQSAVNLQAGYSWSEGVISAGYQYGNWEVKGGWMPAKMPGSGDAVNGFVATVVLGPEWDESGYYFSYSFNSVGYRSQMSYGGGNWTDNYVEGMNILSVGYKVGTYSLYLKADIGYGWSASGKGMSYGVVLGVPITL
jgi:hypothetical protein